MGRPSRCSLAAHSQWSSCSTVWQPPLSVLGRLGLWRWASQGSQEEKRRPGEYATAAVSGLDSITNSGQP